LNKLIIFLILIFFDFLSKKIVYELIDLNTFIPLTFFLDLTHIHNFGVSFGLFAGLISPWILVVIGLLVVIFIYYLMISSSDKIEKMGLLIIISGAISNIIDRILNGYVIDFIYLNYRDLYWPAFNFADIYITLGIMMILSSFFRKIKK
tara:strand:+ start:293 stop:739 length:447 start_codon:yes stop_codon:yes gene_type:complete